MATYPHTFATLPAGNVPASYLDDNFNAALLAANNLSDVANAALARANLGIVGSTGNPPIRQTVTNGPVDTAGLPTFLPATSVNLNLTTQNVTSGTPLTATAANAVLNSSGANLDAFGFAVANLTWSSLTPSVTNYLYVTIDPATGAMTPGFTSLPPIYQLGGTPATTNGQFTFNIGQYVGYLGNGVGAPQAYVVFVGEAVTSGSAVTSTVAYVYNGQYESGFTATLPGTATTTSFSHNLGVMPRFKEFEAECTTNDGGFVVGEQIGTSSGLATETTVGLSASVAVTPKTARVTNATGGTGWFVVGPSSTGGASLTLASWKYRLIARRGW